MENPLKNLPKWGQIAVVGGGALVVYVAYRNYESSSTSSASASTATSGATTAATADAIDPVTGMPTSDDDVDDPMTGMTYLAEATEYGSVSAAESIFEDNGSLDGALGDGYSDVDGTLEETPYSTTTGTETGSNYTSNAQWSQAAQQGLTEIGYTATDVASALGDYLNSIPMSAADVSIVQTALAEYGSPPTGTFSIVQAPTTSTTTPPPAKTTTTADVTVPNVVGMSQEDAVKALSDVGLKSLGTKTVPGKTLTVQSESPKAGSKAAKSSVVKLTSKVITPAKK